MRILLPSLMLVLSGVTAQAQVSQCTTINGEEHCETAQKSLNCQTINGKRTCIKDGVIQHSESTTTRNGKTTQHYESNTTSPSSRQQSKADADKAMAAAGVRIGPNGEVHVNTPGSKVDIDNNKKGNNNRRNYDDDGDNDE